ncbi:MAG: transglycosylase SLT domain-containing protein [Bradyrhizobium sp.]|uniref:transglycosylase SLT domain-containing protein n=1 Tax=Bradyrhizobium sp. TaxID=376 RepID=UPI002394D674|nr:transglycosylase SLT domain-containing protein [Bradyrhizobium sp.]MDE2066044.1 transglycosylase SLT domain-containing protein [Bradyrhizobium sp.]
MATSLQSLSSDLASWGEQQQKDQQQADYLKGQADFYNQTQQGYAEGVRTDQIPANKSPYYAKGYNNAMGVAAGFQLEDKFAASYDNWSADHQGPTDPQAFEQWFADQAKGSITNDNPDFLKGVLPHLQEIHNRYHDRFNKEQDRNAQYTAQAGFGAAAAGAIDSTMQNWQADANAGNVQKPDMVGLGAAIETLRQRGYDMGMKPQQIDQSLVDAIQAKALQYRDPDLLGLFDTKSSAGPALGDTPYGRDAKQKTIDSLNSLWTKETAEAHIQLEREDKLAANAAKASIVDQILKDPKAPIDESLINTVQKVDGNFKLDLLKWRDQVLTNQTADDPRKANQLFQDILQGGDGMDKLTKAIRAGDVQSVDGVTKAVTFIKAVQDFNKSQSGILNTSAAKMYQRQIEEIGIESKFAKGRLLGGPIVLTEDGRQAISNYRYGLMQWGIQNPNASVLDQETYAAKLGEQVLKGFSQDKGQVVYATPPSVDPNANLPFPPHEVKPAKHPAEQQAPQPPPPPAPPPGYGMVTPEVSDQINGALQRLLGAKGGPSSPSSPASPTPPPQPQPAVPQAPAAAPPQAPAQQPKVPQIPGLIQQGSTSPIVPNADGSVSAMRSVTVKDDGGRAILIPTVFGGKAVSDKEAIEHYQKTGEHLGIFKDEASANAYAKEYLPPYISPEDFSRIQKRAQEVGVTVEDAIRQLLAKGKWRGSPQGNTTPGNSPSAPNAPAPGPRSDLGLPLSPTALGAANIPPAQQAAIRSASASLGLGPFADMGGGDQPQTATAATGSQEMMNSARVRRIQESAVGPLVNEVAAKYGMDPAKLAAMVSIESGGNPNISTGSYHGLLQLSQAEFSRYGNGGDILDPRDNLVAGVQALKAKEARFEKEFGREPSATELYLMHQQGEAGLRAHEANPGALAWENMYSTGEGQQKGIGWAKRAVWGNVPQDMRARFGNSVDNLTSRDFMAVWTSKLLGIPFEQALALNTGKAQG